MDMEEYLLLVLADANLPTGSFVASSGLESFAKHGFLPSSNPAERITYFLQSSLGSYARTSLPFVRDAHAIVLEMDGQNLEECRKRLEELDALYGAMTLNRVARRASKAQGVALLTLFSKGFSCPTWLSSVSNEKVSALVENLKLQVRREATPGHLPVCWGVLTASLGLSLERSQYLHLFLHARGVLSAAIRMNIIGPYAAQQLLLHAVKPLVEAQMAQCKEIRTGLSAFGNGSGQDDSFVDGPANTWPLGEILSARHDLQHSRIFNS